MRSRRSRRFHRRWPPSTPTSEDGLVVRIVFASPIATATGGEREFEVDLQGTLRDLFNVVTTKYVRQFQQRIFEADGVFFFQAEDGIRDLIVTGVQTCALPI